MGSSKETLGPKHAGETMNVSCLLTNLTSSDLAAWAQAIVGATAIVVGACCVVWQARRARLQGYEREATELYGLARLLIHLRDTAEEARLERREVQRWPTCHPAEPATRFSELAEALFRMPLGVVYGDAALEALLKTRIVASKIRPLLGPEPELSVNTDLQAMFESCIGILDQQIEILLREANDLLKGKRKACSVERGG